MYLGSWVNLWRIERGNENKNIEFYNYRMGYIAAHEFLHQILVKAYCYINTLENGDPFGFDVSTNPFRGGTHYNRRTNLLSDGNNIWNRPGFPEKRINKLIPEEVIIAEHHRLIRMYQTIRYLENAIPPLSKKAWFPVWAEYWRQLIHEIDFFLK